MKALQVVVILALVLRLVADESAPPPTAGGKTENLPDLIAESLQKNPSIAAARARWEAAKQKVPQATAWDDPIMMLGGQQSTSKGMPVEMTGDFSYGLSQTIPFPGKKRLAGTVAEKEAARAYEEYQVVAQGVVMNLRQTYAELLFNQKILEIDRDLRGWVKGAEQAVAAQVAAGKAMQSDLLQAQVELVQLDNDLAKLTDARADLTVTLNRWLGLPLNTEFTAAVIPEVVEPTERDEDTLRAQALARRPALQALEREAERAKRAVDLARRERLPDFTLSAEMTHFSGDGDLREATLALSVPLPWWNHRKYRALITQEQANYQSAESERNNLQAQTWEEIHHALTKLRVARRTVKLYEETILPRTRTAALNDLTSYQGSLVDYRRLLDSYRTWKKSEMERYQSLADTLKTQAELDALIGAPLPQVITVKKGEQK